MKFWVYSIDWRTRAVAVLSEVASEVEGNKFMASHLKQMAEEEPDRLAEFVQFSTMAVTVASRDMELAAVPFRHKGGVLA